MSSILDLINNLDRSKKILVIGHKKPDTDTIFSSYLMSKVLQSLGYDALYAVLDGEKISEDCTKQVLDNFDYSPFILDKKDISKKKKYTKGVIGNYYNSANFSFNEERNHF